MVVVTGSTSDGKGGSLYLSTVSGGAMSLILGSSMINEGGSVRMLAGSTSGSDMAGGLSIVSGGSPKTGIVGNVDLLIRGSKIIMGRSAKLL